MIFNLDESPLEEFHVVQGLEGEGELCSILLELGFTQGERIRVIARAPFGDPIMIEVRGAVVALRKEEARCIRIRRAS